MSFVLFLAPFPIALLSAFVAGHLLARRAASMPGAITVLLAGLAGVIASVGYLWFWEAIEVAIRDARGDTSDYMGPMVMLVYGYPLFIITWLLCFVMAGYAVRRAK